MKQLQAPSPTKPSVLSPDEQLALAELENVVECGLHESWLAMATIRAERLYRPATWNEYCWDRWGWTGRHVNRHIAAATAEKEMGPGGPKLAEYHLRCLRRLPAQHRAMVIQALQETGKVTAARIEELAALTDGLSDDALREELARSEAQAKATTEDRRHGAELDEAAAWLTRVLACLDKLSKLIGQRIDMEPAEALVEQIMELARRSN